MPERPEEALPRDENPLARQDPQQDDSFAAFVFRWKPGILAFLADKTDGAEDLEDVAAITFIEAWKRLREGFQPADDWRWLTMLARRAVSDWYRWKRKSRNVHRIRFLSLDARTEPIVAVLPFPTNELRESLRAAMADLPEDLRQVVRLRYLEDLPRQEVARRLGLAEWDVKRRLRRARQFLREHLRRQAE